MPRIARWFMCKRRLGACHALELRENASPPSRASADWRQASTEAIMAKSILELGCRAAVRNLLSCSSNWPGPRSSNR